MQIIIDLSHQKSDTLSAYLENGGDPNVSEDAMGVTLLHHAVYAKNYEAVKMLIFWGADPHLRERFFNLSPYELAIDLAWTHGITLMMNDMAASEH